MRDFKPEKIRPEVLKRILDAGLQAPSDNHLREWEFIVIEDEAAKLRLIEPIQKEVFPQEVSRILDAWDDTDTLQREMYFDAIPKQYRMLLNAACIVLPLFHQSYPLLKPQELSSPNAFASIWCCIENILIAAAVEEIYGVTRIPLGKEPEHIRKVTGFPEDYYVPCFIALGYPAENAARVPQHHRPVEEKIHLDKWREIRYYQK